MYGVLALCGALISPLTLSSLFVLLVKQCSTHFQAPCPCLSRCCCCCCFRRWRCHCFAFVVAIVVVDLRHSPLVVFSCEPWSSLPQHGSNPGSIDTHSVCFLLTTKNTFLHYTTLSLLPLVSTPKWLIAQHNIHSFFSYLSVPKCLKQKRLCCFIYLSP